MLLDCLHCQKGSFDFTENHSTKKQEFVEQFIILGRGTAMFISTTGRNPKRRDHLSQALLHPEQPCNLAIADFAVNLVDVADGVAAAAEWTVCP